MIAIRFGLHPLFDLRFGLQFDARRSIEAGATRPPIDGYLVAYVLLCLGLLVYSITK